MLQVRDQYGGLVRAAHRHLFFASAFGFIRHNHDGPDELAAKETRVPGTPSVVLRVEVYKGIVNKQTRDELQKGMVSATGQDPPWGAYRHIRTIPLFANVCVRSRIASSSSDWCSRF